MLHIKKLHILEDVHTKAEEASGTAVRVEKEKKSLDEVLGGQEIVWNVETLNADRQVVCITKLDSLALIEFLGESSVENILVSVSDSRQLIGMMFHPKVTVNLSASTFEYFDRDALLKRILRGFLTDLHFPKFPLV